MDFILRDCKIKVEILKGQKEALVGIYVAIVYSESNYVTLHTRLPRLEVAEPNFGKKIQKISKTKKWSLTRETLNAYNS